MKILKIPGETNALVNELRDIRRRKKADTKREDEITTKLKEVAESSPATLMFNAAIVAMIEEQTQNRINTDKLRANFPDAAEACTEPQSFLKVKCC